MRAGLSADTSANDTDFETISRSSATNEFANRRATGAMLEGAAMDGRFNWHFGVANSNTAAQILRGVVVAGQANDDTDYGGYVQLSYTMAKSGSMQPGFVARFGTVNLDQAGENFEGPEFVLGASAYFAEHNLKWQLQYASGTVENFVAEDIESSSISLRCTVVF